MKIHRPFNPAENRAWQTLESVAGHPLVKQWQAEADALVQSRDQARTRRWHRWPLAAAAGTAALAFFVGYWHLAPDYYQTHLGEQRDVTLSDGSRMTLNTGTSVSVRYSRDRRYIELRRGEALFAVQPQADRPFDVEAGGTLTRALGTEFNVDLRGPKVTVSVIEGAVSVVPTAATGSDALLRPGRGAETSMTALSKGQAVEFRVKEGRVQEQHADLRRIDAWRRRQLEFTNTPLAEAIEEFNRYSVVHIVVGTPDLASVRVSGVFSIGDAEGFLYSLREALNLETHESSGEVIVMRQAQ